MGNKKETINQYSTGRAAKATLFLFTFIVRRKFGEDGVLVNTQGDYPEGREDDTHLSENGAHAIALMALSECIAISVPFANRIH